MHFPELVLFIAGGAAGALLPEVAARIGWFIGKMNCRVAPKAPGDRYTVLCLGDSLSDGYPRHLRELLRERYGDRFRVLEEGAASHCVGNQSSVLAAGLEALLDEHRPDAVVVMIGLYDKGSLTGGRTDAVVGKLRFYRFIASRLEAGIRAAGALWSRSRFAALVLSSLLKQWQRRGGFDRQRAARHAGAAADLIDRGRFGEAKKSAEEAVRADPYASDGWWCLGRVYQEWLRVVAAEGAFRTAITAEPHRSDGYSGLAWYYQDYWGWMFCRQGVLEDMRDLFERVLALNPHDAGAHTGLGWIAAVEGRPEEAEQAFLRAAEANPRDGRSFIERGLLYRRRGRSAEAENALRQAVATGTGDSRAFSSLGWVYADGGKPAEAKEMFFRALAANRRDAAAYAGLCWVCTPAEAEEILTKALEERQPYEIVETLCRLLALLHYTGGRFDAAESYFALVRKMAEENVNPVTRRACNEIVERVVRRGIDVLLMQYPVREIAPLKKMVDDGRAVVWVDNERSFREALRNGNVRDLFDDLCGHDFGHCTEKGNRLIAENVARALAQAAKV